MLNVTKEQMIKCISEIYQGTVFTDDDISVDYVYDMVANDMPYYIKTLLKSLILEVYGSGDDFQRIWGNIVQKRDKEKNLEYFRENVFIDGVGYHGRRIDQPDEEIKENEFSEDDYDEPYVEGVKAPPVNDYDGSYPTNIDMEQVPPTPPAWDYASYSIPDNLKEADLLYGAIMGRVVNISDNIVKGENTCKLPNGTKVLFETTADNYITDGFAVLVRDRIGFKIEGCDHIDPHFMLVSSTDSVAMVGKLIKIDDWYYISTSAKNINFKLMRRSEYMYSLVFKDEKKDTFYSMEIAVNFQPYTEYKNEAILCIDFGTSNTTVGFFDQKSNGRGAIELVDFVDVTSKEYKTSKLCPTLVYIDKINCSEEDFRDEGDNDQNMGITVDYLFGFDAQKVLIESGYNPKGDVFFEIKRWMVSSNEKEDIRDGRRRTTVKRIDIISEYLHYILEEAQNCFKRRFKKLHFSAPVKLKEVFIDKISKYIFTKEDGFEVMSAEESVDEAISIVYKYISDRIVEYENANSQFDRDNVPNDKTILVLDCGGGTTDVASCHYKFRKNDTFYDVELSPKFVNGNSNFGGNNITYRIFQLLKIRLADHYRNNDSGETASNLDISKLISKNQNEVLGSIDDSISEGRKISVYDELDKASKESEKIIPTDFNGSSLYARSENNKKNTKMNFYHLWQLAENTKLTFFEKTGRLSFRPLSSRIHTVDNGEEIVKVDSSSNVFYIANENSPGSMKLAAIVPDVEIKINEISAVVAPEIYYLLASVNAFENEDYFRIKLTGQSCKINLFSELLKEFIPGKKLRMREKQGYVQKSDYSERLKLECVYGSILYTRDKIFQGIRASINRVSQKIIYDLVLSRGNIGTKETVLFNGGSFKERRNRHGKMQLSAFPLNIETYHLNDGNGMILKVYNTLCNKEKAEASRSDPIPFKNDVNEKNRINLERDTVEDGEITVPSLKTCLLDKRSRTYYNLENCKVYEDGEVSEQSLLDRLVLDIKGKIYDEDGSDNAVPKRLVFGIPNSDGYGFILYQLISKYDANGNRVYYCNADGRPFESGKMMKKTFFSGNNCGDIGDDNE